MDGPLDGFHGYHRPRVDARLAAKKPILRNAPNMRMLVVEDYVMQHFVGYAERMLSEAEVIGL